MRLVVAENEDNEVMLVYIRTSKQELEKVLETMQQNDFEPEDAMDVRLNRASEAQLIQVMSGERTRWDNNAQLEDLRNPQ